MSLEALLETRKEAVRRRWCDLTLASYPADSASFMRREKDRFQNPVGHAIESGTGAVIAGILAGSETADLARSLEEIVRIRAVQEMNPSTAVGFVFLLKRAVRYEIPECRETPEGLKELSDLDDRVDELALLAFDIFSLCRQEISEIRVDAMQRRVSTLLERAERLNGPLEDSMERIDTECHDKEGGGA